MRSRPTLVACGIAAALSVSCARDFPPPGGEPDRAPPQVVGTEPEALAVVPDLDRPIVIRFDERISERGIDESVTISPETGEVRVEKGRRELRISLEGGWRRGQIYRVVVLPVVRDLFGNTRREAVDLVFSTGPPIANTAVAGVVEDRLTGLPVRDARVEAIRRADSVVYVAASDSAGFFALRHIPEGEYDVRAYVDRVRNRRPDLAEPFDSSVASLGVSDTSIISFALLPGDTTAARMVRAEAPDSAHIRVQLDDYLDPDEPLDAVEVTLLRLPDSTAVAVSEVLHGHEFERRMARQRAAADSAAAASDSLKVVAAPAAPLPSRDLVVVPADPLPPETQLVVTVAGIRNIHGLAEGGGSAELRTPKRPEPPAPGEAADTLPPLPARPDSVPPDTVPRDAGRPVLSDPVGRR